MLKVTVLAILVVSLISCQKDIKPDNTPVDKNLLLVKAVTKFKEDSFAYSFQYNASAQLIEEDFIESWQGAKDTAQTSIGRNSEGIIQVLSYKSSQLRKLGFDDFTYNVIYDETQATYVAKVAYYTIKDSSYRDSVVFTSNSSKQIVTEELFSTSGSPTGGYAPAGKKEYVYDNNGNVIERKEYSNKNSTKEYKLTLSYKNQYDAKQAPITLGAEAIVVGDVQFAPTNNPVKTTYTDNVRASNNYNSTTGYTFNADNWPITATVNYEGGTTSLVTTYAYQAP